MEMSDIRRAVEAEADSDSLQQLPENFYERAITLIKTLKQKRNKCDDPYGKHAKRMTDEIETVENQLRTLLEHRQGKVVRSAAFYASVGGERPPELTDREAELFGDVSDRLTRSQERLEGMLDPDGPPLHTDTGAVGVNDATGNGEGSSPDHTENAETTTVTGEADQSETNTLADALGEPQ